MTSKPGYTDFSSFPSSLSRVIPDAGRFSEGIQHMDSSLTRLALSMQHVEKYGALEVARAFVLMRAFKSDMELLFQKWNALFAYYNKLRVPEILDDDGVMNVPLAEGYRVGTSLTIRVSIKDGQKEPAYGWLRDNDLGDLIQPSVHAGTLSAALTPMIREENREPPAEHFRVYEDVGTTVNKIK